MQALAKNERNGKVRKSAFALTRNDAHGDPELVACKGQMLARGISLEEMSIETGLAISTIRDALNGSRRYRVAARKIANALRRMTTGNEASADSEGTLLKLEMLRRGVSIEELSERTGLRVVTLRNVLCGSNRHRKTLRKVNAAMGTVLFKNIEPAPEKQTC